MTDELHRKSIRLREYDYATNGAYHVTICTKNREKVLSRIVNVGEGLCALPKVQLTAIGEVVASTIRYIQEHESNVHIVHYVIMPDHVHLLILLEEKGGRGSPPLHEIIKRLKTYTTRCYGQVLWQRSFHDHIIRGRQDLEETWQYIDNNPIRWIQNKKEVDHR